jgi:3-methyladenine DNA glycosylase AlkD
LRQLAHSASGDRLAREAELRAAQEAEHKRQRDTELQQLMADVDTRWTTIDALAQRGSSSSYDQAVRELADLAEGYALTASRQDFDRALRRLLVRHAHRSALLRRLAKAGLRPA